VHVWTVDEQADIEYVLNLGVDAVISNHPRRVLRQLGRV
jgi:glycerophosphoryl diester phosphodiesterase